jgi:hypothetical protein
MGKAILSDMRQMQWLFFPQLRLLREPFVTKTGLIIYLSCFGFISVFFALGAILLKIFKRR